jgi:hypothetical protein
MGAILFSAGSMAYCVSLSILLLAGDHAFHGQLIPPIPPGLLYDCHCKGLSRIGVCKKIKIIGLGLLDFRAPR